PLRDRGPVLQLPAAGSGVSTQLARDRGRVAVDPARDLAHAYLLSVQDSDLLPLRKRYITSARLGEFNHPHAATLSEPACPDGCRHAHLPGCLLRGASRRYLFPEPAFDAAARLRGAWRYLLRPARAYIQLRCAVRVCHGHSSC